MVYLSLAIYFADNKIGVYIMIKKLVIAAAISISVVGLAGCSNDGDPEVVVKTDAGDITKEEFYDALKEQQGEQVLDEMVTLKVLEENYEVSDEEVDEEINSFKEQLGDQFEMWMQQQGFTDEDSLKKVIKLSLLQEKAASEDVEVSEDEMKKRYEKMKTEIEAQHILVDDEETAKEVKKKLDDGEKFKDLAKERSEEHTSELQSRFDLVCRLLLEQKQVRRPHRRRAGRRGSLQLRGPVRRGRRAAGRHCPPGARPRGRGRVAPRPSPARRPSRPRR